MPSLISLASTSSSIQFAIVAFALSGLIGVAVHRAMVKASIVNKTNKDDKSQPGFDENAAWLLVGIITIPCGVIIWALLQFLWPIVVGWLLALLDWINSW